MLNKFKSKLKNLVGVLFVFMGFVLCIGSISPEKENIQILIQGVSGIFLVWLGYEISKEPTGPIELAGLDELHEHTDEIKDLSKAIYYFRRKALNDTGQTIPVTVYIKRSYMFKMRDRNQNIFHHEKETFEGWPVKVLSEEHEVDFKIFKAKI